MSMKKYIVFGILLVLAAAPGRAQSSQSNSNAHPRIVNIVNFIRLLEPRDPAVTEEVLYQTVVKQVAMMKKYKLGGTFLLQYDALLDSRYQNLLKRLPRNIFEIGAWWEIPQPLVEEAGLTWRGRYPWDWHADVGFSTGYTPEERVKLVDVYMARFKKIFGYYPQSVGSWFIDAHTLNYLWTKYHIVASCNCKDQMGTDGYTLWGGYWNQAYYPSKINSYMPAQNEANQTPVPIFRMLGSDPVRQYDNGLGTERQGVVTLEPVYKFGGGDASWVNWYFKEFVEGQSMGFAYTQAGQENSFTWAAMEHGFALQLPLIAQLSNQKKVRVETLAASGRWFKQHYTVTPATSVTVNKDIEGSNRKTVWFNSRFFRINLLWEDGGLRIRDMHLFAEEFPSVYTKGKATSNECSFFTLPFIDGYAWSKPGLWAGMRFKANVGGTDILLQGGDPVVNDAEPGNLHISWPITTVKDTLRMVIDEGKVSMQLDGPMKLDWFLELSTADSARLPFQRIAEKAVTANFEGMEYTVKAMAGKFVAAAAPAVFRIAPTDSRIELSLTGAKPLKSL